LTINVWVLFSVVLNSMSVTCITAQKHAYRTAGLRFNLALALSFQACSFLLQKNWCVSVSLCTNCLRGEETIVNRMSQKDYLMLWVLEWSWVFLN